MSPARLLLPWTACVFACVAGCAAGSRAPAPRDPPAVATLGTETAAPAARFKQPIRAVLLVRCLAGDPARPAAPGAVRARFQSELGGQFTRPAGSSAPAVRMAKPAGPALIVLDYPWGDRVTFHVDLTLNVDPAPDDEPDFTHKVTLEGNVLYGAPDDSYYGSAGRSAWAAFEQALDDAAAGLEKNPGRLGKVERRPF